MTVVAWGNCVEQTLIAAEKLGNTISLEVIDLRSMKPWDRETIAASLEKTGRLVVVQEDSEVCSVGQMIISETDQQREQLVQLRQPAATCLAA